jgi:hypothetical protein
MDFGTFKQQEPTRLLFDTFVVSSHEQPMRACCRVGEDELGVAIYRKNVILPVVHRYLTNDNDKMVVQLSVASTVCLRRSLH